MIKIEQKLIIAGIISGVFAISLAFSVAAGTSLVNTNPFSSGLINNFTVTSSAVYSANIHSGNDPVTLGFLIKRTEDEGSFFHKDEHLHAAYAKLENLPTFLKDMKEADMLYDNMLRICDHGVCSNATHIVPYNVVYSDGISEGEAKLAIATFNAHHLSAEEGGVYLLMFEYQGKYYKAMIVGVDSS